MKHVAVIDYGAGNLFSLLKALRFFGVSPKVVQTSEAIASSDMIILPGVGAFSSGMKAIGDRGLVPSIQAFCASGKPVLGICLGAQLLMSDGYEFEHTKGLDCVAGQVVKFPILAPGYHVPNINWNPVELPVGAIAYLWKGTPLAQIVPDSQFYFVHSFVCEPDDSRDVLATTTYGGFTFCSMYRHANIFGCQFHPEKSAQAGLVFLKSCLDLV